MRFVPSVDDGSFQGGLQAHRLLEEVGPLGQLICNVTSIPEGQFAAHLSRSGKYLSGHKVGSGVLNDSTERSRPIHQIVLVASVTVALAVGIVLIDDQLLTLWKHLVGRFHGLDQNHLRCPVLKNHREGVSTLWSGKFRVGVVNVVTGTVGEDGVYEMGFDLGR